jgi:hypothetical protein
LNIFIEKGTAMEKIRDKLLMYWSFKHEYEKRIILRDCADIFIFGRKESTPYYNEEDFHIIKLLRIARNKYTKDEFLKFIESLAEKDERAMDYMVNVYINGAVRKLTDLGNEIYSFKERQVLQEPIM